MQTNMNFPNQYEFPGFTSSRLLLRDRLWQGRTAEDIVKTSVEKLTNIEGRLKSETFLAHLPYFKF